MSATSLAAGPARADATAQARRRAVLPREIADELRPPIVSADLIADRRGSRVWQVILDDRRILAVKYTQPDPSDTAGIRPRAAELAAREAAVLQAMPDDHGYLYAAARSEHGTWLAVNWINKLDLHQVWQRSDTIGRRARDRHQLIVQIVLAAATALDHLHRSGWMHPDLAADHILFSHRTARLIDYAWAQGPNTVEPDVPYSGGPAQVTAPEIAEQLLATTADNVRLTPAAEVYTLAAVVGSLWSGQAVRNLDAAGGDGATLADIYRTICNPMTLRSVDFGGTRPLAHLLTEMLAQRPADRPPIAEVRERLVWLAERT